MKKVKIIFWLVILIIIATIFYQNIGFLMHKPELSLNILLAKYNTSDIPNAFLFAAVFLAGLLISYLSCFSEKLKSHKTIKKLNTEVAFHIQELSKFTKVSNKQNESVNKEETDAENLNDHTTS